VKNSGWDWILSVCCSGRPSAAVSCHRRLHACVRGWGRGRIPTLQDPNCRSDPSIYNVKNALFASAVHLSIYRKKERKKESKRKGTRQTRKKEGKWPNGKKHLSIRCMHPAKGKENPSVGMHGSSLSASCVLVSAAVRQLSPLPMQVSHPPLGRQCTR
jgi:hypothetical protein